MRLRFTNYFILFPTMDDLIRELDAVPADVNGRRRNGRATGLDGRRLIPGRNPWLTTIALVGPIEDRLSDAERERRLSEIKKIKDDRSVIARYGESVHDAYAGF
jgi:hypothetical protein